MKKPIKRKVPSATSSRNVRKPALGTRGRVAPVSIAAIRVELTPSVKALPKELREPAMELIRGDSGEARRFFSIATIGHEVKLAEPQWKHFFKIVKVLVTKHPEERVRYDLLSNFTESQPWQPTQQKPLIDIFKSCIRPKNSRGVRILAAKALFNLKDWGSKEAESILDAVVKREEKRRDRDSAWLVLSYIAKTGTTQGMA